MALFIKQEFCFKEEDFPRLWCSTSYHCMYIYVYLQQKRLRGGAHGLFQ